MPRIKFSPYAHARVAAMRSTLLKTENYRRMQNMGYHEQLHYLHEIGYQLQGDLTKAQPLAVEMMLQTALQNVVKKIIRISEPTTKNLIKTYALRYDILQIKWALRAKYTNKQMPVLAPPLSMGGTMQKIIKAQTFQAAVLACPIPASTSLFEIENSLDTWYLEQLWQQSQEIRPANIASLLHQEIEHRNIITILRSHQAKPEEQKYFDAMVTHPSQFIKKLRENKANILSMLAAKGWIPKDENIDINHIEENIIKTILKKQRLLGNQQILSPQRFLSYLFAKEIEVRNVMLLLKGKLLDIPKERISEMIIV